MSIIDRIRRIAQANIHSLLDKVDTPEMVIQDKIGELEKTMTEASNGRKWCLMTSLMFKQYSKYIIRQKAFHSIPPQGWIFSCRIIFCDVFLE